MQDIASLIQAKKTQAKFAKKATFNKRPIVQITQEDFKCLFISIANRIILEDGFDHNFIINNDNKYCLNQIYYWLTGSKNFEGHTISKGIMLTGPFGTGKTLIIKTLIELYSDLTGYNINAYNSLKIPAMVKEFGTKNYEKKPMFIDEIGRETQEVNDYGTKIKPIIELLSYRFNNNALTFATTNFDRDELIKIYKSYLATRIGTMMNIFELKGDSKRPKLKVIKDA